MQRTAYRPMQEFLKNEGAGVLVICALGLVGYVFFPNDLAFLTRIVSIALLVISLDLVVGYCGVATLGHSAVFGIAAYAVANVCRIGVADPGLLILIGCCAGAGVGLVSGLLIARFQGLPQLVLTIALGQLVYALSNKLSWLTGGSDGMSDYAPGKVFGHFAFDMYGRTAFIMSIVTLALVFAALLRIVRSPFGLMAKAIKDDPLKVRMIGASVYPRIVVMYALSGGVAGIGGALNAITAGVVGLDSVSFERSAAALVMLVLGGAGNLWGALAGTIVFHVFEHIVSSANPFHWMILVGAMLIAVVLFAPRGLSYGALAAWSAIGAKLR